MNLINIPFFFSRVEVHLDKLELSEVISLTTFARWATPLVTVDKTDGDIRLCEDYRLTVNEALHPVPYPLTTIDEAFAQLSNGQLFTKLDFETAYAQLPVSNQTAECLTIATHHGLYKVNRLACVDGAGHVPANNQQPVVRDRPCGRPAGRCPAGRR